MKLLVYAMVLVATLAAATAGANGSANRLLRVGYLAAEDLGHPPLEGLEAMRDALLGVPALAEAMAAEGYDGIGLFSCDGATDMVRRIEAREFQVVFAPAVVYAQQQGGYIPVLSSRRSGDLFAPGRVWRHGVVIVSSRSPLFGVKDPGAGDLAAELARRPIALVRTQSVTGFHAPLLRLANEYRIDPTASGYTWFASSEDVVRAVVSGLADVGACEEPAIASALEGTPLAANPETALRILVRTDPVATDPVLLHPDLAPRRSPFGRLLREEIRRHFLATDQSGIQYIQASDRDYRTLRSLLQEFDERVGDPSR